MLFPHILDSITAIFLYLLLSGIILFGGYTLFNKNSSNDTKQALIILLSAGWLCIILGFLGMYLKMNEAYTYCHSIFDDESKAHLQSMNLAKLLYNSSSHPNIKAGELCVAYLTDCVVDGELTDGIGIFKSENKDAFIKITNSGKTFELEKQ